MTSPRLLTGILHPLYELATGRRIRDKLRPAEKRQWWTRQALLDYQWQELLRLFEHAYATVPFYRRRFAEVGLTPRDIRSPEELAILPPLTKEDIQQHGKELVARDLAAAGAVRRRATGGSTGQNLTFVNDQRSLDYRTAAAIRSDALCGMHQGARQAKLWGSPDDARRARRLGYWLADRLQNRIYLDAFDLTSGAMRAFAARLQRFRPEAILGYATCLHAFATFLEREGIRIPPPRTVISSAETLHDAQRTVIERALGCAVHNRYGCREMGPIAAECDRHRGLHVFADERLVEVVSGGRPAAPGEPGELIVTDLRNYAMPFIRYRIGDVGEVAAGTCACGLGFPLLARVIGRTSDLIVAPDGRLIHGEYFTHLFYFQHAVASFRVHQPRLDSLEVTVVPAAGAAPDLEAIGAAVRHAMGSGVEVEVRTAGALPPAPSGKLRFTTSAVPHDFLTARGSGRARAA